MSVVELVPVVSLVSVPVTVVGSVVTELLVESEVLVEVVSVVVVGSVALGSEVVLTVPPVLVPSRTRHISSWTEAGATQPLLSTAHALHTRPSAHSVFAYAQWSLLITTQPASAPNEAAAANASAGRSLIEVQEERMA